MEDVADSVQLRQVSTTTSLVFVHTLLQSLFALMYVCGLEPPRSFIDKSSALLTLYSAVNSIDLFKLDNINIVNGPLCISCCSVC